MKKLANKLQAKIASYLKRKHRVNTKIKDITDLPRLVVNKSNKYNYAQIIDLNGSVVASSNDLKVTEGTKTQRAVTVGTELAKKALEKWIKKVAFDRNGFLYHGRVSSIAEWARNGWLEL